MPPRGVLTLPLGVRDPPSCLDFPSCLDDVDVPEEPPDVVVDVPAGPHINEPSAALAVEDVEIPLNLGNEAASSAFAFSSTSLTQVFNAPNRPSEAQRTIARIKGMK